MKWRRESIKEKEHLANGYWRNEPTNLKRQQSREAFAGQKFLEQQELDVHDIELNIHNYSPADLDLDLIRDLAVNTLVEELNQMKRID